MIGVVVVTHGQLATELVNAAEMIVGDLPRFTAVSIGWHDDVNDAREEIAQAIRTLSARFDHVFSSGGVGPTHDDVTLAAETPDVPEVVPVPEPGTALLMLGGAAAYVARRLKKKVTNV